MLRLVITNKGDSFQEERTFGDSPEERADLVTIGRAETNDVVLDDPEGGISRYHAVLVRLPGPAGEYFVRDLSSRNSTWVEGQAVCTRRLRHGDIITRGFVALFDPDTDACHCVARQLATSEKIRIADGDFLETLRQGMRIAEGRVLLVPFRRAGEVAGFFCANRKPGKPFFSLEDGDFLENLGSQLITHLLERARRRAGGEHGGGEVVDEGLEWPLEMVGHSAAMKKAWRQLQEALEHEVPVLITGETGTGKELVATAIHRRSSRSQGPLVAINCAAIPESLLESELFGHEKGAFTDARDQHQGLFEQGSERTRTPQSTSPSTRLPWPAPITLPSGPFSMT